MYIWKSHSRIFAVVLGAYSNAGGTVGRATFNIIGPLLSLSVAALVAKSFGSEAEDSSRE